ncbi:sulfatase-like hydrolase/transferase [Tichowtungia aerotolerans]|uniref:Sulfatase-like hydrolase/transferase n=1 Tax=Tichowtungia aerotolerans TaxID=2697043 RepID=A0A6P1M8X1_9BACT|nr:sulfatase-like hydrolase/transferase [Tichowtungia aerotolerans]QHI68548.1 sulfatase-like hydrolase/transferase [Tichowtungia aerotolerans]
MRNRIYKTGVAALLAGFWAMAKPEPPPNILVVLVDDMGYSDLGCFGSCIETPTVDRLAAEGLTLTQFYNTARCMPSRASLLTGLYPHKAGMGYMAEPLDALAYQGHLNHNCMTIAEALNAAGYWTMHSGKWHVAHTLRDQQHAPCRRGFDRSFLRSFRVNYFNPPWLAVNFTGDPAQCKSKEELGFDDSFYLTDAEADYAIRFLEEWKSEQAQKPFFMYLAFDAPHWPMHARPEDIAKYRWKKDKFRNGWDEVRERRFKAMQKRKILDPSWTLPPRDPALPAWDSIPGDSADGWDGVPMNQYDKDDWDLKMAVYAAMIDRMDQKLGDVIAWLEKSGVRDNTLILFLADNGGCPEEVGSHDRREVGTPESYQGCFMPWAHVQNTPFRMYKHWVHEGGISTPCIINWPAGMDESVKGALDRTPGHVVDVMATCLDAAGAELPDVFEREGRAYRIQPPEGESLLPLLNGGALPERALFFEHEGNRAVRDGDWKLVSRYEKDVQLYSHYGYPAAPRAAEWELYNLKNDRTETTDLAAACPEIASRLAKKYQAWTVQSGARPWSELEPVFDLQVAERRPILQFEQSFERGAEPGAVGRASRRFSCAGQDALHESPVDCRQALTVSMWVQFDSVPELGKDCYLLGQMNWPTKGFHLHYRDGQWIFNLLRRDGIAALKHRRSVVPGEWVHLGAIWNGQTARLYLNGEEVQSAAVPGMDPSDAALWIGGNGRDKGAGGLIDDVRVYNTALSPEILRGLYQQGNEVRLALDFDRLAPRFAPGDSVGSVSSSVFLPQKAAGGSDVVWSSSHPDILGHDGRLIHRPADRRQVELTARLRLYAGEKVKRFNVAISGQVR